MQQFTGWEEGEVQNCFKSVLKTPPNTTRWDLVVHVFEEGNQYSKEIWKSDVVDKISQKPKPPKRKPPKRKPPEVQVEHEPDEKDAEVEGSDLTTYITPEMEEWLKHRLNRWLQNFAKWQIT